ncbi:alkene reductase [Pseudomonas sp. ME-P-057]|uniref:alkene reductase n=1 Tax=Pseudomonas sp. ME-P-057 TaxID=3040321 RepID=UPI00255642F6|nr:alkene reductase [Pseudomonas sp. ME-P-057]
MTLYLQKELLIGKARLSHRVVMAPLTRLRATEPAGVPTELMVEYYAQRASEGGLIITEATNISEQAKGVPGAPGIFTDEQQQSWRKVVEAVHAKGGVIFLQLWHTGRASHSSHNSLGSLPVGPSAIAVSSNAMGAGFQNCPREAPTPLSREAIAAIVADYRTATSRAINAGFDGVEIHAANGYLIDQFLHDNVNTRKDEYGGPVSSRAKFLLEVVDAVGEASSGRPVGVRLSPYGTFNDMHDSDPEHLFREVIHLLGRKPVSYLHLIEPRANAGLREEHDMTKPSSVSRLFHNTFPRPIIVSGGFNRQRAESLIQDEMADAIAFGRHFISNPDLPNRLFNDHPLSAYDRATFYGGGAAGYTDYAEFTSL